MKFFRKGQLEIMGLVVIVILISLAMVFFIQFALLKEPSSERAAYTRGQLSTNTLNTLMVTKTTCGGRDFTLLIEDCMDNITDYRCGFNQPVCAFVRDEIESILNMTLKKWGKNYQLKVFRVGQEPKINITAGQCLGTKDYSEYFTTGRSPGRIFIALNVCER